MLTFWGDGDVTSGFGSPGKKPGPKRLNTNKYLLLLMATHPALLSRNLIG